MTAQAACYQDGCKYVTRLCAATINTTKIPVPVGGGGSEVVVSGSVVTSVVVTSSVVTSVVVVVTSAVTVVISADVISVDVVVPSVVDNVVADVVVDVVVVVTPSSPKKHCVWMVSSLTIPSGPRTSQPPHPVRGHCTYFSCSFTIAPL